MRRMVEHPVEHNNILGMMQPWHVLPIIGSAVSYRNRVDAVYLPAIQVTDALSHLSAHVAGAASEVKHLQWPRALHDVRSEPLVQRHIALLGRAMIGLLVHGRDESCWDSFIVHTTRSMCTHLHAAGTLHNYRGLVRTNSVAGPPSGDGAAPACDSVRRYADGGELLPYVVPYPGTVYISDTMVYCISRGEVIENLCHGLSLSLYKSLCMSMYTLNIRTQLEGDGIYIGITC